MFLHGEIGLRCMTLIARLPSYPDFQLQTAVVPSDDELDRWLRSHLVGLFSSFTLTPNSTLGGGKIPLTVRDSPRTFLVSLVSQIS